MSALTSVAVVCMYGWSVINVHTICVLTVWEVTTGCCWWWRGFDEMMKSVVLTRYPSQEMVRYSYTRLVILCPFQINSLQFADFGWSKLGTSSDLLTNALS